MGFGLTASFSGCLACRAWETLWSVLPSLQPGLLLEAASRSGCPGASLHLQLVSAPLSALAVPRTPHPVPLFTLFVFRDVVASFLLLSLFPDTWSSLKTQRPGHPLCAASPALELTTPSWASSLLLLNTHRRVD